MGKVQLWGNQLGGWEWVVVEMLSFTQQILSTSRVLVVRGIAVITVSALM